MDTLLIDPLQSGREKVLLMPTTAENTAEFSSQAGKDTK